MEINQQQEERCLFELHMSILASSMQYCRSTVAIATNHFIEALVVISVGLLRRRQASVAHHEKRLRNGYATFPCRTFRRLNYFDGIRSAHPG
jgi:hypothetical protein